MLKFFLTPILFSLLFVSLGQTKVNHNKLDTNDTFISVTLLGTGTPQPLMDRFGPSILVQAGSKNLLFDAGRGCLQRLRQLKVEYNFIDALFFTHLHSDHIVGLPDLWLTGWLVSRRNIPLLIFGPEGSKQMTDNLQKAYSFDIKIRIEDDKASAEGYKLITSNIREGVVYNEGGVKYLLF